MFRAQQKYVIKDMSLPEKVFAFMKKRLLLLLITFALVPCAAQQPPPPQQAQTAMCVSSSVTDAPAFFGLRLSMTPAQVRAVFGKTLKLKIKRKGTFFQNFIDKKPPAFLPDVRALYLRFFDRKLYQIEIFYADAEETREPARRFIETLAAQLALPPAALWENRFERYKLTCGDFSLAADRTLNRHLELTDEVLRLRFEESQQKDKDKN